MLKLVAAKLSEPQGSAMPQRGKDSGRIPDTGDGSGATVKEFRQGDPENAGHHAKVQDRQVAFATLHRADERAVEAATVARFGLRPLSGQPEVPQTNSQVSEVALLVRGSSVLDTDDDLADDVFSQHLRRS